MRRLWLLCSLLLLVACRDKAPVDGALQVTVLYGSYTPGCVRVVARDGQGHEGRADIPRSEFQSRDTRQLRVAVFRKPDWGRELTVEVSSHEASSGEECTGTPVEVRTSSGPVTIPPKDFAQTSVTLLAKDDDGDSFIQPAEGVTGTDCDDGLGDVHPGATEQCSVNVDYDCNGSKGCQDSACQDKACDDGNACTTGDRCQGSGPSAACVGQEKQCTVSTGACVQGARCEPSTGACVDIAKEPGTACDDGNPCTLNDQCGPGTQCTGTQKSCATPPTLCHENTGTCDTVNGQCSYAFKAASASCDDGESCTVSDACDGAGVCQGMQTPCSPSSVCMRVTGGCVGRNNCTEVPDPTQVNQACMINATRAGVCRTQDGVCSTFPYVPSNFNPDLIAVTSIGTLTTTCGVTFDSESLSWSPPECITERPSPAVVNEGGKDMVLLPMSSLSLGGDLILRGTRPVILAVYGSATLTHSILANGALVGGVAVPGAGGNQDCATRKGGNGGLTINAGGGGGGAGGATAGAAGGIGKESIVNGGSAGTAGTSGGGSLVPLVGGCPGGDGGGGATEVGKGGAGGGAVQISVAGTLTVNQEVTTSGGGGGGGLGGNGNAGGGGGGGSGGRVLLEAHTLVLAASARLTANGGGGGEGGGYVNSTSTSNGATGQGGALDSATPAAGGADGSYSGGDGGAGGAGAVAPGTGSAGGTSGAKAGGGGGGGAVGHIRLRSLATCTVTAGAIISPSTNTTCPL